MRVAWPLLSSVELRQRDALVAAAHCRTFSRGEVLFREEPGDSDYLVVTTLTPDGESALLSGLGPGDSFGEHLRLRRALLVRATTHADPSRPSAPVVVPLTQEELADVVGSTRPSVNKALGALVVGLVSVGCGRVTVLDPRALERLADS